MAKKKKTEKPVEKMDQNTHILGAGEVLRQNITDTLETNYMPYAMSVILSRAIPEIDGFKPSHRKLLYTMYKMGLINGARTKSANIVGQTMKLNPHGDVAIYDTMVRLSRGYEALLHPFVDSKGNFGKAYSRDMQWAAPRYTEAKLAPICTELFAEIDKDTVDFVDNYDNTMKEPSLLPVRFPSILANPTTGIAVGMASSICPFNLRELCETTIALIKDPEADISETLKAPDFAGGGLLLYDRDVIDTIYKTGRGGFKIRAKYNYDKDGSALISPKFRRLRLPKRLSTRLSKNLSPDLCVKSAISVTKRTSRDLKLQSTSKKARIPTSSCRSFIRLLLSRIHSPATLMY